LIVTAVVTHPQGIAQIIGGTLTDPSGASYGAFMVSTTSGSYSITLTWSAIELVQDITTGPAGEPRMFVATFYDQAGHSTAKSFTIQLTCGAAMYGACNGTCTSLQGLNNCGSCGRTCTAYFMISSNSGLSCSSDGKCERLQQTTTIQSCNDACKPYGLTCASTNGAYYQFGTSTTQAPPVTIDCTTVPSASIVYMNETYDFHLANCICSEP
jgi:hypothetical protein